jgi:hypothetical protein
VAGRYVWPVFFQGAALARAIAVWERSNLTQRHSLHMAVCEWSGRLHGLVSCVSSAS